MLITTLIACAGVTGKLFLVGGGRTPEEVPGRFIKECGGPSALIIVLPLASAEPDGRSSEKLLQDNGAKNTWIFAKAKPTPEDLEELKGKLKEVRGIWMPGGVQGRIIERLGKKWCDENIKPLLAKGVNFYGTSAGAMVCSDPMIEGPGPEPETAKIGPGFGLTSYIIDSHTAQRNRVPRLKHALKQAGREKGIGINEREYVVIHDDKIVEKTGTPTIIEPAADIGRKEPALRSGG
ncbi:MAG TPA: cyanophycinase [Fimbriimonadaceae bacterium]|nr:cyanophycinase [Fimbriimonadaceae bacterium]